MYTQFLPNQRQGYGAVKLNQHFVHDESSIHASTSNMSFDDEIIVNEQYVEMSMSSNGNHIRS